MFLKKTELMIYENPYRAVWTCSGVTYKRRVCGAPEYKSSMMAFRSSVDNFEFIDSALIFFSNSPFS